MRVELESYRPNNRAAWRRWLKTHHQSSSGVWVLFYKKHTGKATVTYQEALEEALCHGWIDSIVRRVDGESYMQKFTPRINPKKWSALNLSHMRRLIDEGLMTPAGLQVLDVPLDRLEERTAKAKELTKEEVVPDFVESAITRNQKAEAFWQELAPGYRRRYISWILNAKGDDTRRRRLEEVVGYLVAGTKSVLK